MKKVLYQLCTPRVSSRDAWFKKLVPRDFSSLIVSSESNWGETFAKQEAPTSCGLVSAQNHAKILSNIFKHSNRMNDRLDAMVELGSRSEAEATKFVVDSVPNFTRDGLTLEQLHHFVLNGSSDYEIHRNAEDAVDFSLANFETILLEQITLFGSVIVNYDMTALGQSPAGGHLSLVAGLAELQNSDRNKEMVALLLDCWPETPLAWIPTRALYHAINTADRGNDGKYRGFLKRKQRLN